MEDEQNLSGVARLIRACCALSLLLPWLLRGAVQDIQAGKRTEIDALNGAIVRLADANGLPADVNRTLVRIVHSMEAGRA